MRRDRKTNRIGEERLSNQGYLMRIVTYIDCRNIIIEFQDTYKAKVHTSYDSFIKGQVKNPYATTVCGVGIIGNKYPATINRVAIKEYDTWRHMLARCYDKKYKNEHPTYKDAICCSEWLNYENFYEWLHSQENFDKWLKLDKSSLDKDILIKGNKLYSSDTCCLVPHNVNSLFTKRDNDRGDYPIGIHKKNDKFIVQCNNPFTNKRMCLSDNCQTVEEAFIIYKNYKEDIIKKVAKIEYNIGNITKECYEAMIKYQIEITD